MADSFHISLADGPADMAHVRELFSTYQAWLGGDLCFQDFQAELDDLPGVYARPMGCLLLARRDAEVVGVVGIRPAAVSNCDKGSRCEMKRLFVLPEARGCGVGRELSIASMDYAQKAGYQSMYLETLVELEAAIYLYRCLGFTEIANGSGAALARPVGMELNLGLS